MEPAVNYDRSTHRRRLVRIAVGVVAAAGGVLLIAIGQLALTPIARADKVAVIEAGYAGPAAAATELTALTKPTF
jgi:hypothetical protein